MEFVEKLFVITRRKQEGLLARMGISGTLVKEVIGPMHETTLAVSVDNTQFAEILKSRLGEKVLRNTIMVSDTHATYDFYMDIGEGVTIKTPAVDTEYRDKRNVIDDLWEMSYRPNDKKSEGDWRVYEIEKTESL